MTDVTTTSKQQKEAAHLSPADEQVPRELTARAGCWASTTYA
jgi:hypothetical protein